MDGICNYAIEEMTDFHMNLNINFQIECIKKQAPFPDDLLNISMNADLLKSDLFQNIFGSFCDLVLGSSNKER